jgi:hypothetical protein
VAVETLEEKLQHISDTAKIRRTRFTEVTPIIEEAIAELERLREFEFMYQGLTK